MNNNYANKISGLSCIICILMALLSFGTLSAQTLIQIDIGSSTGDNPTSLAGWNNVTVFTEVGTPLDLVDSNGAATGISLTVTQAFGGPNVGGFKDGTIDFPDTVTRDNLFGDNNAASQPKIEFSGLDLNSTYLFTIYASRVGVSDVRSAVYTLSGETTVSQEFDAANNETGLMTFADLSPNGDGKIIYDMVTAASNTLTAGNTYLSGIIIHANTSSVPEPSAVGLLLGLSVVFGWGMSRSRRRNL